MYIGKDSDLIFVKESREFLEKFEPVDEEAREFAGFLTDFEPANMNPGLITDLPPAEKKQQAFPVFVSPDGKKYTLIAYAVDPFRSNFEWFAFEIAETSENGATYFGYVEGLFNEFGYFTSAELERNGIEICADPAELCNLQPPVGWTKEEV